MKRAGRLALVVVLLTASDVPFQFVATSAPQCGDEKPSAEKPPRTDLYGNPLPEGAIARLGTVRGTAVKRANGSSDGHQQRITCLAYSRDGSILASGGEDGVVWLWNPTAARAIRKLEPDPNPARRDEHGYLHITSVQFSPDGKTLATTSTDFLVRLWDVQTGKERLMLRGHEHRHVSCVAFSPDGKTLASSAHDGTVRIWDVSTGNALHVLGPASGERDLPAPLRCVAFAADGKLLAAAGLHHVILLWDPRTGKHLGVVDAGGRTVTALAFAPESDTLAVAGGRAAVQLFDLPSWKAYLTITHEEDLGVGLAWLPDGKCFTSLGADRQTLYFRDLNSGKIRARAQADIGASCIAISPDGKTFATRSAETTVIIRSLPQNLRKERK